MKEGVCDGVLLWRGKKRIGWCKRGVMGSVGEKYKLFYLVWFCIKWVVGF